MMDSSGRRNVYTSTSKSHEFLPRLPVYFETSMNDIDPSFQHPNKLSTSSRFSLTSHTEHNQKQLRGPFYHEIYSKAPAHWTTFFLNELAEKLRHRPTVRVVSNYLSEMQDHYRGQPKIACGVQHEHYSMIQELHRQLERAQTVLDKPECSITKADFKFPHRLDWSPHSILEAASFNGTLTKSGAQSRLPAHKAPSTLSCQPRLPFPTHPLPHRGKTSLYRDSFTVPVPHQTPLTALNERKVELHKSRGRAFSEDILGVPKMYNTEYQTYGGNKIVLV